MWYSLDDNLWARIHEANRRFYEFESRKQELSVYEGGKPAEQERLLNMLKVIDRIISSN